MDTPTPRENTPRPPRTRREVAAEETRQKIVLGALDLIKELGWRATTVERIAARAGVAKGTFFVHFPNKEAVVEALIALQIDAARRASEDNAARSPLERLRETVLTLGRHAGSSVELSRAVLIAMAQSPDVARSIEAMFEEIRQRMVADAGEAVRQGLLVGTGAEQLAELLLVSYMGTLLRFVTSASPGTFEDFLLRHVDATLAAFARDSKPGPKTKSKRRGS